MNFFKKLSLYLCVLAVKLLCLIFKGNLKGEQYEQYEKELVYTTARTTTQNIERTFSRKHNSPQRYNMG